MCGCSDMYDVLTDTSPIPAHSLHSFQPLTWNISLSVARDIQVAKEKLDKSVVSPCAALPRSSFLFSYLSSYCLPSLTL